MRQNQKESLLDESTANALEDGEETNIKEQIEEMEK
jgi:hypothetical protein